MLQKKLFIGIYIFCAWIFTFFSYIFTDTNLVLTTNSVYWTFQQWLWHNLLPKTELITYIYILLTILLFLSFFGILKILKDKEIFFKEIVLLLAITWLPFFLSHNALSHDIYNYIFNAKIVLEYQGNPHASSAGDYSGDLWLRFMHNTHTLSPYGYAWTATTLLPFIFGFGKFILIYFNLKLLVLLSLVTTVYYLLKIMDISGEKKWKIFLFALNPLIMLETISSAHNDVLMMQFAVMSYYYLILFTQQKKPSFINRNLFLAISLLAISVGMKISTVILFPLILIVIILKYFPIKNIKLDKLVFNYFPLICSLIMFVPLFFERSEQFYPWYLIWSLAWMPLIKNKYILFALLGFSLSSMLRYVPWIDSGFNYGDEVEKIQRIITWLGGISGFIIFLVLDIINLKKSKNEN